MNPLRKIAVGGALTAAALAGGALGAAFFGTAFAATGTSTSTSTPAGSNGTRPNFPAHGTPEHEASEKPVTGDAATKAQAAAVKSLGGGTAGAVTTDASGNGYEVTVTKADGSQVEVHLDSAFNVMQGGGRHGGGRGCDHGGAPGGAPSGSSNTTTNPAAGSNSAT